MKETTIYCDKHTSYKGFFEENDIKYEAFKASLHINRENKEVHNQNINTYARDFKDFVNKRLKGVSTKYIGQYAKWFQFHHAAKTMINNKIDAGDKVKFNITDQVCREIVGDNAGLDNYRKLEIDFQDFLKENDRTDFGLCKNHYYTKAA